jgi:hypothetical protein
MTSLSIFIRMPPRQPYSRGGPPFSSLCSISASTGISGGQYIFAPGVEVLPGTTYWVYENGAIGASGGNAVSGDVAYYTPSASSDFVALSEETGVANFTLDGTVAGVPEPATVGTLLGGLAVLAAVRCRKRRAGIGAT